MKNRNICSIPSCRNYQSYCRLHQGYTVPVKSEIPKKSDKQKEADKEYKKVRAKYLKAHPFCEAKLEGCGKVSVEIHHKRGRIGEDLINPDFFLACCQKCHMVIEANPAWAKQNGFSVSRHAKINKAS
jgi:hypothetical protein